MVPVGPGASPRSGPWSVGRWLARRGARIIALERPPSFALGFPLARKPMTSVLFTLGRSQNRRESSMNLKAVTSYRQRS